MSEKKKWIEIEDKIKIGENMIGQMNILRVVLSLILLMPMCSLNAQEIEVTAPTEIFEGEKFQVKYAFTVLGSFSENDNIRLIDTDNFEILGAPKVQRFLPPFSSRRDVYTLSIVYVLRANKSGKLKLPRLEIKASGQKILSEKRDVVVSKLPELGNVDFFVETSATKVTLQKSDTLTLVYKLYTTQEISRVLDVNIPYSNGFYYHDITPALYRHSFTEENIDGIEYKVYVIKKYILEPYSLGTFSLPEGHVKIEYTYPTGRIKTDRWGTRYEEMLRDVKSCEIEPIVLKVHNMITI